MDIIMLIIGVVTLIVTGVSTGIAAFQLKKLNNEKRNVNINIKKLYSQNIKINKKYIEDNLRRFEGTIEKITNGPKDKEKYLQNIDCLAYYISSINNKKFEEVLKYLINDTEDFIKISMETQNNQLDIAFKLHAELKTLLSRIENGNYVINTMFKDFDKALQEDYKRINFSDKMDISFMENPNIFSFYEKINSKLTYNVLYHPPGNPSILAFATPRMYYGRQISKIQKSLGIYGSKNMKDIPYISINETSEKGDFKLLMKSLNIYQTIKSLNSIIEKIHFMLK